MFVSRHGVLISSLEQLGALRRLGGQVCTVFVLTPPPPLYKLRPCPSYSRRRDRINLVPNLNSVQNVVQPRGVWGMAHVFEGKLYFTRDHMQGNFIPKNLKLPQPKPAPKP